MTQTNLSLVTDGDGPDPDVERLWAAVFRCSAIVIVHAEKFGFTGMHKPDPNIHGMLLYVKMVEGAIDALVGDPEVVSYDDIRLLLNAQKQMATLKQVANALMNKDADGFKSAMRDLEGQAPF